VIATDKKIIVSIFAIAVCVCALAWSGYTAYSLTLQYNTLVIQHNALVDQYNQLIEYLFSLNSGEGASSIGQKSLVHMRIQIWDGDVLVLDEYCSGVVTDLGDNMTLYKWFGDADMQYESLAHNVNCSWISIGNQGTLTSASTQLPGEWNRTTLAVDNEHQSYLNASCTFYPDDQGPYTADCIGINCASSGDGNLVYYDTFTEVTGIDEDFTINVDFKITESHS